MNISLRSRRRMSSGGSNRGDCRSASSQRGAAARQPQVKAVVTWQPSLSDQFTDTYRSQMPSALSSAARCPRPYGSDSARQGKVSFGQRWEYRYRSDGWQRLPVLTAKFSRPAVMTCASLIGLTAEQLEVFDFPRRPIPSAIDDDRFRKAEFWVCDPPT